QRMTTATAQLPAIAQTPALQSIDSSEPTDRLPVGAVSFHFDSNSLCEQGVPDSDVASEQNRICQPDSEAARLKVSGSEGKDERRPNAVIRSVGFKEQPVPFREESLSPSTIRSSADRQRQLQTCSIAAKAEEIAMGLSRELKGRLRLPFLDY